MRHEKATKPRTDLAKRSIRSSTLAERNHADAAFLRGDFDGISGLGQRPTRTVGQAECTLCGTPDPEALANPTREAVVTEVIGTAWLLDRKTRKVTTATYPLGQATTVTQALALGRAFLSLALKHGRQAEYTAATLDGELVAYYDVPARAPLRFK